MTILLMISQRRTPRVSKRPHIFRKQSSPCASTHDDALYLRYLNTTTTTTATTSILLSLLGSYIFLLTTIFEVLLLTVIGVLQLVLISLHRHTRSIPLLSKFGASEKSVTNENYYIWWWLRHLLRLDPRTLQSCLIDDSPQTQNTVCTTPWRRTQTPHSYFLDKSLSASNDNWMRTPRTKFGRTKKSKFRKIRRLSSLLFLGNHHDYKNTPSTEHRKTRKTELNLATLTTTTTNTLNTSNTPSNLATTQSLNAYETMTSNSSSHSGLTTPSNIRIINSMPRPEQLSPLWFNGTDVTEFLRRWNIECEDAGYDDKGKCRRLPFYCEPTVKDVVELLDGYLEEDWAKLENDLKGQYWQNDTQKNTLTALNQLIRDAHILDLGVYVLKYASITKALVDNNEMSVMQRCRRFLDGLSEQLRDKAFDFCSTKDWKLSSLDTGTKDPDFDELKKFIIGKALATKKKVVYNKERATEGYDELKESAAAITQTPPAPPTSPTSTTNITPAATPNADPMMVELTKQIASLTLAIQANMSPAKPPQVSAMESRPQRAYDRHCIWCDSTSHSRRTDCTDFKEAMQKGLIAINADNRIINAKTGEEVPPMFNRGGMKKMFAFITNTPTVASTSNITLEGPKPVYGQLGPEGTVLFTTLDFENDTRTDEVIDIEVYEKRRRDDILRRRVRPRLDDEHVIPPPPRTDDHNTNATPPTSNTVPAANPSTSADTPAKANKERKFKYMSELNQTIDASTIGERIMDTTVELPVRHILAAAPDVAGYIHDMTRKRRVPIDKPEDTMAMQSTTRATPISVSTNSAIYKAYYDCPSGRAKVLLDKQLNTYGLLDNGSEVLMMPRRVHERLDLPIDTEINWRINGYNTETNSILEEAKPIGCCHDVSIDVGGVEVRLPVFVVEHCNSDIILGRPWERMVRAQYFNEDDGSLTVFIRSLDGRRVVKFCAVKGEHERNREYVRHAEEGVIGDDFLKV
jgi:hypothetical protein